MEKALNANPMHFPVLLGDVRLEMIIAFLYLPTSLDIQVDDTIALFLFRCQLHLCKCRSSVAMLPVLVMDRLPISVSTQYKLSRLGKHCIFLQFKNHQHYFLVSNL